MLKLYRSPPLERSHVTVGSEADRIPKTHRALDPQLVLECLEPVPHLRPGVASDAVLEEHGHDRKHRKTAIRKLRLQLPCFLFGILRSQRLPTIVSRSASLVILEAT